MFHYNLRICPEARNYLCEFRTEFVEEEPLQVEVYFTLCSLIAAIVRNDREKIQLHGLNRLFDVVVCLML